MSPRPKAFRQLMQFLGPMVRDRLAKEKEFGPDWSDKPNDLISWLIEDAAPADRTVPGIAMRILIMNMAAIHTITMTFADALFNLTMYPTHIQPMREEVERAIKQDSWTKTAIDKMHKLDSFFRESQRLNGSSVVAMNRKVVAKTGFKFSDGTVIPFESFVAVSGQLVQHDPANYDHPEDFDGFRFSRMREAVGQSDQSKKYMVSTAPEHLDFGLGKHACPGRFFAATELKAMLAHVLLKYDIKAYGEGVRPPPFFGSGKPNPTVKIYFRKRQ
ncbi:hypothetical protein MVEN_00736900 [Mycena venus]|uniref:Cytochrome P450 n=1 Tax=Mycena venus TaxID=2733690 RepID=A0A8H7D5Z8_9AGAR|nr:hypothetical protein MVEN_00736900 [Mycena venus]